VEIVKSGIVMSPEGRRIFPHLTVLENLRLGAYSRSDEPQILKDTEWIFDLFPSCGTARTRKAAPFRAASSRCSPWAGRS